MDHYDRFEDTETSRFGAVTLHAFKIPSAPGKLIGTARFEVSLIQHYMVFSFGEASKNRRKTSRLLHVEICFTGIELTLFFRIV
jgi:hypothetical protein